MDWSSIFISDRLELGRVLVGGLLAYVALVVFLRFSGKRTLATLNAFDFVVTVALGSTLATTILPSSAGMIEGALALALLIVLQFAVAWLQVRSVGFRRLVKSEPALIVRDGHLLDEALRRERLAADEVFAALRSSGVSDLEQVAAAVLETDGSVSVLQQAPDRAVRPTLRNVRGAE